MKKLRTLKDVIKSINRSSIKGGQYLDVSRAARWVLSWDLQNEATRWIKRLKEDHPLNEFKKREEYIQGQIDFIEVFFNLKEK